jgi:outer membrane protein assembly factor BamB
MSHNATQRRLFTYALATAIFSATSARAQIPAPGEPAVAPHAAAPATQPGGMMDRAAESGAQVYVDDSFASIDQLRTASRYASQGQSQLAITTYQNIIDIYGQKLVYLSNDSYMSITDYVCGKLLQMPAVQSGTYDQLFGVQAQQAIDAAVEAHNLPELMRACDRFFPSTAAFDGLSTAAAWHFEQADFSTAARLWQKLLAHPRAKKNLAELLFRQAVAESLAGDATAATTLRSRLVTEFPDATASINGQPTPLLAKLDEVLAIPAWHPPEAAKDEWPAFQGGPTRENLLSVHASIGAQLWSVDLNGGSGSEETSAVHARRGNGRMLTPSRLQPGGLPPDPPLTSYPVLSGGTLFIHNDDHVVALSANAGTFLWSYPEPSPRGDELRAEAAAAMRAGGGGAMPMQAAAHDSVSIFGDRAFAVLPVREGSPNGDDEVEDNAAGMGETQVVCLDRTDGHKRWATPARSLTIGGKNDLIFVGSPLVTKAGVFVVARKIGQGAFVESYIVRLNAETGAPDWTCYLCSASTGMFYGATGFTNVPIPSLVDEVLYISTGQGATCAVDANVGRILWLQVAASAKKVRSPNEFYNPMQAAPSWKFNPPLVYGDKVITLETAASDSAVSIYDRWNGRLIRSFTAKDLGMETVDVLAGIVGSTLVVDGSQAVAMDLEKIGERAAIMWRCDFPSDEETGRPEGRPFLSQTGLYVPFEKGMVLVDVATGKSGDFWQWPRTEKDVMGKPGNLLVTSEQVVVVTETDIAGYSRWETARDNRLAQIQAHPQDPQAYLALAEIAYRTNHLDMADENMKEAVTLATAASPGEAAGDLLGRLYRTALNFAEQLANKADTAVRDRARFYFEQCKATARTPEQQAEWRLTMSDFSLAQNKPEEAATLYNEVLTDSSLRGSAYHRKDATARAGVAAELKFRLLIQQSGAGVYARFEDQAKSLLANAESQHDPALLQQTVDSYPNSAAAIAAATELASTYRDKQDWGAAIKVLRWLYPRTDGDEKGRVTADLAMAQLAMKRYAGALAWAERGLRQYKNLSWNDPVTQQTLTFATLRDKLRSSGMALAEGRRPELPPPQADASGRPAMDDASATEVFAQGSLLVPLEQSPAFRRPDLLFVFLNRGLHVYPVGKSASLPPPWSVELPQGGGAGTCAVLGSLGDMTVVAESRAVVGINTQTHALAWQVMLSRPQGDRENGAANNGRRNFAQINGGRLIIQGNARVIINGQLVTAGDLADMNGDGIQASDPEVIRQLAFARLGRPAFSTMRMIDDKLIIIANGSMSAIDVATGKPAWSDGNGAALSVKLPAGTSNVVTGNEDLVVAEVNNGEATSFFVVDAETGKFRKQINLDNERAKWRAVGDDGTLYVVSDQAISAYDLFADQDEPLWRRSDIQSRFPEATVLTLDGLVLVNTNSELMCLSLQGGEVRWPVPPSGPIRLDIPEPSALRVVEDGDNVIYESSKEIVVYASAPQEAPNDQLTWRAEINAGSVPPLDSIQMSDPYVVALAIGPTIGGVQRSVQLILMERKQGKIHLIKSIQRSANAADLEGPVINAWQVVDNGVALEVGGAVHFYHGKVGG